MMRALARIFFVVVVAGFATVSACSEDPVPPKLRSVTEDLGSMLRDPIPVHGGAEAPLARGAAASPSKAPTHEATRSEPAAPAPMAAPVKAPPVNPLENPPVKEAAGLASGPTIWNGESEVWDDGGPLLSEESRETASSAAAAADVSGVDGEEQARVKEEEAGELARVRSPSPSPSASPEVDSMSLDERGELIRRLLGVYASLGSPE